MAADRHIVFYHSPHTRSSATHILLQELGADYELRALNMKLGEQRQSAFLAVNPMGKVPTIVHGDQLITEQVAIFLYLADLYPEAGLAPALGDPLRGAYLRWMVYYAACFEPAVVDIALKRAPGEAGMSPYGDFETVLATIKAQLAKGPYILGDRFSAADILWSSGLGWTTGFGLVPKGAEISDYLARLGQRPSVTKLLAEDNELAAAHEAIAAAASAKTA